jgi:hypothetical protein
MRDVCARGKNYHANSTERAKSPIDLVLDVLLLLGDYRHRSEELRLLELGHQLVLEFCHLSYCFAH